MVSGALLVGALDWTIVTAAVIAGVFSLANTVAAALLYRLLRVPSGGKIGEVAERTHDLAAASVSHTTKIVEELNGGTDHTRESAA